MKFQKHKLSKRFPEVEAALVVYHQPIQPHPYPYRSTAAAFVLKDGRFYIGTSTCSPFDPFVKATGRQKATGRAFQLLFHAPDGILTNPVDAPEAMTELLDHMKDDIERAQHTILAEHAFNQPRQRMSQP